MMILNILLFLAQGVLKAVQAVDDIWINELSYIYRKYPFDAQYVEVAFVGSPQDLDQHRIALYRVGDVVQSLFGKHQASLLSETPFSMDSIACDESLLCFAVIFFEGQTLRDGSDGTLFGKAPGDGICLVGPDNSMIEFISYDQGKPVTATDGPCTGSTSVDIGLKETPKLVPQGSSLQLMGTGSSGSSYSWGRSPTTTAGTINNGQVYVAASTAPSVAPTAPPSTSPSTPPSTSPSTPPSTPPSDPPSAEPSTSTEPSSIPSTEPSTSAIPSIAPSDEPSTSAIPSGSPSTEPSTSAIPSIPPSDEPSTSAIPSGPPSDEPSTSVVPSGSVIPSGSPSTEPSISAFPSISQKPSFDPSISQKPSFDANGKVNRDFWTFSGNFADLKNIAVDPDFSDVLSGPALDQGSMGNGYGQRIRGYITPASSGAYFFWIASDDQSELLISTDDNPANAGVVASVSGWTGVYQWNKFPSQKSSSALALVAGTRYFFQIWHREGGGGDHFAVSWSTVDVTPTGSSSIVPDSVLSAFDTQI